MPTITNYGEVVNTGNIQTQGTGTSVYAGAVQVTGALGSASLAAQGGIQYGAASQIQGGGTQFAQGVQAATLASQGAIQYGAASQIQGGGTQFAQSVQAATLASQGGITYGAASALQGGSAVFGQTVQSGALTASSLASQGGITYGAGSALQGGSAVFGQTVQSGAHTASSLISQGAIQYGTTSQIQGGGAQFAQTIGTATIQCSAVQCTGDVIALVSDDRLKNRITNIQQALGKVNSLNGFIYKFNDLAKTFGFGDEEKHAGLSAQEVKKVLPEVIKPAPFNPEYMTVQYEKVVPLLVEALKELTVRVEALEFHTKLRN